MKPLTELAEALAPSNGPKTIFINPRPQMMMPTIHDGFANIINLSTIAFQMSSRRLDLSALAVMVNRNLLSGPKIV
jgi:hypothetical protein